jgi:hypothetical protein
MKPSRFVVVAAFAALAPEPAQAQYYEHFQIYQAIGGVNGNTGIQAIELRETVPGQVDLRSGRLVVADARGHHPVVLKDFLTLVSNNDLDVSILVATANFSTITNPPLTPDFILTNLIPESYLAAGTLTYEEDTSEVFWRLSWGGAKYTGTGAGELDNDNDGNFNPPYDGPLPSAGTDALYNWYDALQSSTNQFDYAPTSGGAIFTNNAGQSAVVQGVVGVWDRRPGAAALTAPFPNPMKGSMACSVVLPAESRVRVRILDLQGRLVGTLVDRWLPAGRNGFTWEGEADGGDRAASGLYLLELETGGIRQVRRLAVLD